MAYLQRDGATISYNTTNQNHAASTSRECGCSYGHGCECGVLDLKKQQQGNLIMNQVCNECEGCKKNAASLARTGRPGKRRCMNPPHVQNQYTHVSVGDQQIKVLKSVINTNTLEIARTISSSAQKSPTQVAILEQYDGQVTQQSSQDVGLSDVKQEDAHGLTREDAYQTGTLTGTTQSEQHKTPKDQLRAQRIAYVQRRKELEVVVARDAARHAELTAEIRLIQERSAAVDPVVGDKLMVDTKIAHGTWQRMNILKAEQLISDAIGRLDESLAVNRNELSGLVNFLEHRAAIVIQRVIRGTITRNHFGSTVKLYREYNLHTSAITLQRVARGWQGRKRCRIVRAAKHSLCATTLQCAWRSSVARRELRKRQLTHNNYVQNQASRRIQSLFLNYKARAILRVMKAERNRVQVERDRNAQAITIQKLARGMIARKLKRAMRVELRLNPRLRHLCNKHFTKGDLYKFLEEVNRDYELHQIQQEELRANETENAQLFIQQVLELRSAKAKQVWEKWESAKVENILNRQLSIEQTTTEKKRSPVGSVKDKANQLRSIPYLALATSNAHSSARKQQRTKTRKHKTQTLTIPQAKDDLYHLHEEIRKFEEKVFETNSQTKFTRNGNVAQDKLTNVYRNGKPALRVRKANASYTANLAKASAGPALKGVGRVERTQELVEAEYQEMKTSYFSELQAKSLLPESPTHLLSQAWKDWKEIGDVPMLNSQNQSKSRAPQMHQVSRSAVDVASENQPSRVPLRVIQRSKLPGARSIECEIPSLDEPVDRVVLYAVMMTYVPSCARLLGAKEDVRGKGPGHQFRLYLSQLPPLAKITYEQESLQVAQEPIQILKQHGLVTCGSLVNRDLTKIGIPQTLNRAIRLVLTELCNRLDATRPKSIEEQWRKVARTLTPREISDTVQVGVSASGQSSTTAMVKDTTFAQEFASGTQQAASTPQFVSNTQHVQAQCSLGTSDRQHRDFRFEVQTLENNYANVTRQDLEPTQHDIANETGVDASADVLQSSSNTYDGKIGEDTAQTHSRPSTAATTACGSRPSTACTVVGSSVNQHNEVVPLLEGEVSKDSILRTSPTIALAQDTATPTTPNNHVEEHEWAIAKVGQPLKLAAPTNTKLGPNNSADTKSYPSVCVAELESSKPVKSKRYPSVVGLRPSTTETSATIDWNHSDLAIPTSRECRRIERGQIHFHSIPEPKGLEISASESSSLQTLAHKTDPVDSIVMQCLLEHAIPAEVHPDYVTEPQDSVMRLSHTDFVRTIEKLPKDASTTKRSLVKERLRVMWKVAQPIVKVLQDAGFRTVTSLAACRFETLGIDATFASLLRQSLERIHMKGITIRGYESREPLPTIHSTRKCLASEALIPSATKPIFGLDTAGFLKERKSRTSGPVSGLDKHWRKVTGIECKPRKVNYTTRHDQLVARVLGRAKEQAENFVLSDTSEVSKPMSYAEWKDTERIGQTTSVNGEVRRRG